MIALLKYIRSLELIDYIYFLTGRSEESIKPQLVELPRNIIFICTGNICRSAYAQKKFPYLYNDPAIKINSAGLVTEEGKPADPKALEIAIKRKINLMAHRTQCATFDRLSEADLILIMDSSHYDKIDPAFSKKVRYLGCFGTPKRISIKDPFGKSDEIFENCFNQIDAALEGLAAELKRHSRKNIENESLETSIYER